MAHTTALRRIFLLALAFVPSSAFIASPTVRAPQLAGHCPETLPRSAAPARFGQPKKVRIASGGERDAIEDAVRIYKDAVRAKEAGALDEAAVLFTNATDLMRAVYSHDAYEVYGDGFSQDGFWYRLFGDDQLARLLGRVGVPFQSVRPRGMYVEAITFGVYYGLILVIFTAKSTLQHPELLSDADTRRIAITVFSIVIVLVRLSPFWIVMERTMYYIYDQYTIWVLQERYAREDEE